MGTGLAFDLYWSFRSPYCYFTLPRLLEIERAYDLEIRLWPVYPIAVRNPDFFKRVHPNYRRYHLLDSKRVAEFLDIPYRRPRPDPIVQDMETHEIAREQPYIHRLTRLAMAAVLAGCGLRFTVEVSRILWDGSVDGWDRGTHLADAVARAGLELAELDRAIAAEPSKYDALIADNAQALEASGHWGVPTMVFQGEPFFGQDRIPLLVWRMRRHGLRRRAGS